MKLSQVTVTESDLARFWKYVDKRGPDECWPWIGASFNAPGFEYGMFSVGGRSFGAHRVSLRIALGDDFVDDLQGCHSCDNPPCVNPNHLFQGTQGDNLNDAKTKGRRENAGFRKGSRNLYAKVTDLGVLFIRMNPWGWTQQKLGNAFGIEQQAISKIQRGERWKHV